MSLKPTWTGSLSERRPLLPIPLPLPKTTCLRSVLTYSLTTAGLLGIALTTTRLMHSIWEPDSAYTEMTTLIPPPCQATGPSQSCLESSALESTLRITTTVIHSTPTGSLSQWSPQSYHCYRLAPSIYSRQTTTPMSSMIITVAWLISKLAQVEPVCTRLISSCLTQRVLPTMWIIKTSDTRVAMRFTSICWTELPMALLFGCLPMKGPWSTHFNWVWQLLQRVLPFCLFWSETVCLPDVLIRCIYFL